MGHRTQASSSLLHFAPQALSDNSQARMTGQILPARDIEKEKRGGLGGAGTEYYDCEPSE
jgi:hypothetical protein